MQAAQKMANIRVDHVIACFSGAGPRSYGLTGQVEVEGPVVDEQDVSRVLAACEVPDYGDGREVLHAQPVNFALDHRSGMNDPRGQIVYFDESRRRALDLYRNSIVHYLAAPSFLARTLLRGATEKELREDLATWQDLLYQEFFAPRGEDIIRELEKLDPNALTPLEALQKLAQWRERL